MTWTSQLIQDTLYRLSKDAPGNRQFLPAHEAASALQELDAALTRITALQTANTRRQKEAERLAAGVEIRDSRAESKTVPYCPYCARHLGAGHSLDCPKVTYPLVAGDPAPVRRG